MKKYQFAKIIPIILVFALVLCACGAKQPSVSIPYSDMTWESTLDDVLATEGENYETYESIYKGMTYTFDKEFKGQAGTIKYMFDSNDALMNIAWTCSSDNAADIMVIYNDLYKSLVEEYGEPSQNMDGVNNYAEVWKLDSGNIIVSAVVTSDAKMVQVSFLNPIVSKN